MGCRSRALQRRHPARRLLSWVVRAEWDGLPDPRHGNGATLVRSPLTPLCAQASQPLGLLALPCDGASAPITLGARDNAVTTMGGLELAGVRGVEHFARRANGL
jgi:hypothetical protein